MHFFELRSERANPFVGERAQGVATTKTVARKLYVHPHAQKDRSSPRTPLI